MRQLKITHSITNRADKSLDKYLQDICSEELLTPEEEVELAQRIKAGDQAALDRLTKANLRTFLINTKYFSLQYLKETPFKGPAFAPDTNLKVKLKVYNFTNIRIYSIIVMH